MNWYNKSTRLAFRNRIDKDAVIISKMITDYIKSLIINDSLGNYTKIYELSKFEYLGYGQLECQELINAKLNITVENRKKLCDSVMSEGLTLDGGTKDQTIELFIVYNDNFTIANLQQLSLAVLYIIRHELQHVIDNINKKYKKEPKRKVNQILDKITQLSNEMLSDREIEAYVRGIMLSAKRSRKPFEIVASNFIDMCFYSGNKNTIQRSKIYNQLRIIEQYTLQALINKASFLFSKIKK